MNSPASTPPLALQFCVVSISSFTTVLLPLSLSHPPFFFLSRKYFSPTGLNVEPSRAQTEEDALRHVTSLRFFYHAVINRKLRDGTLYHFGTHAKQQHIHSMHRCKDYFAFNRFLFHREHVFILYLLFRMLQIPVAVTAITCAAVSVATSSAIKRSW